MVQVSVKTVSKWETGNGYPNIAVLQKLAKALKCTVNMILDGSSFPDVGDNRLDYENSDNPLQNTEFEGIWIIKPFHTMLDSIKHNPTVHLQVIKKETKEIVLDFNNCVACWSGISGWDGIVSNDLTLVTTDFKQYIYKHELYNIINPQNLRII